MNFSVTKDFITTNLTKETLYSAASFTCTGALNVAKKIGPIALNAFKIYTLYSMYEMALSDLLCLKTFRHGTNPVAVIKITCGGPDNTKAGTAGEAKFWEEGLEQKSYWKDRDIKRQAFYVAEDVKTNKTFDSVTGNVFMRYLGPKVVVKYYSAISTATLLGTSLPLPKKWKAPVIQGLAEGFKNPKYKELSLIGWMLPTVKFHLNPDRVKIIEKDLDNVHNPSKSEGFTTFYRDFGVPEGGVCTKDQMHFSDVGLLGVLKNGVNTRLFKRISENKGQFLWGLAQLVTAVAVTAFLFPWVIPAGWVVPAALTSIAVLPIIGHGVHEVICGIVGVYAFTQF